MSSGRGTKRGRTNTATRRNNRAATGSRKQPCERGRFCPYRDEYQHQLEFSHDNDPIVYSNPRPFSGQGHQLGSAGPLDDFLHRDNLLRQHQAFEDERSICEICNKYVPFKDVAAHTLQHEEERERNRIKQAQDDELEQSLLEDIKRQQEAEELKKSIEEINRRKAEDEELQAALKLSLEQSKREEKENAKANLAPEPDTPSTGKIVTLRFTLPDGRKILRSFLKNSSVQDAIQFANAQLPCSQDLSMLRTATGNVKISAQEKQTFFELGILSNISMIVLAADVEADQSGQVQQDTAGTGTGTNTDTSNDTSTSCANKTSSNTSSSSSSSGSSSSSSSSSNSSSSSSSGIRSSSNGGNSATAVADIASKDNKAVRTLSAAAAGIIEILDDDEEQEVEEVQLPTIQPKNKKGRTTRIVIDLT